jgi:hypothetical protein
MLVNRYNFLRWDNGIEPVTIESDLPNGYIRDASRCDYRPLLIPSEAMRFYINAPDGLGFTGMETFTLDLIKENGTLHEADIAPLQVHSFTIDTIEYKTFYGEIVIIDGSVPAGNYFFRIMDGEDVKLTSNQVQVIKTGYLDYSAVAKFRHDSYFYGILYADLAGFYQQFRLHLNVIDRQFEGDKEIYKEVTTGKRRTFNNQMDELVKVETYYFDKMAHEAAGVMFNHDEIFLNLKRYISKGTYKVNYEVTGKNYKGDIELYKDEFSTANRCTG